MFHKVYDASKRICSPSVFEAEKQKLKEIFLDNVCPKDRLSHVIHRFENPKPQVPGAEAPGKKRENAIALSLPFVPGVTDKISREWKRISRHYGIDLDTTVVQRPIGKLKTSLCRPYEKDPAGQGVYRATCLKCQKSYIGETGLRLETRVISHKRCQKSALSSHVHGIESFDFQFLQRVHNTNRRKIYESFTISDSEPDLNRNSGVERYVFPKLP